MGRDVFIADAWWLRPALARAAIPLSCLVFEGASGVRPKDFEVSIERDCGETLEGVENLAVSSWCAIDGDGFEATLELKIASSSLYE